MTDFLHCPGNIASSAIVPKDNSMVLNIRSDFKVGSRGGNTF